MGSVLRGKPSSYSLALVAVGFMPPLASLVIQAPGTVILFFRGCFSGRLGMEEYKLKVNGFCCPLRYIFYGKEAQ